MNEISRFAEDYFTMTKINPFKHKRWKFKIDEW